MVAAGTAKRVDELNRIVLPKEVCKQLNIKENDALEIFLDCDAIVLRKFTPAAQAQRKSDLLLRPSYSTKDWNFSREEANER